MKKNIESAIEKALASLDGMESAAANPFLYGKVMHRLQHGKAEPVYSTRAVLSYVMVILMLTGMNAVTIYRWQQTSKSLDANAELQEMVDAYFIPSQTNSFQ